jgi:hypothetical protein
MSCAILRHLQYYVAAYFIILAQNLPAMPENAKFRLVSTLILR